MRSVSLVFAAACLVCCAPDAPEAEPPAAAPVAATLSDEDVIQRFHQIWNANPDGLFKNTFLGVRTWQNPFDVWITQEIFYEVKPDVVVEAGTFRGGSALLWATLLAPINPDAEIITIDIKDKRPPEAREHPLARSKITFLLGSSIDPEIVSRVEERVRGKRVVVILDSLHTAEHVLAELRAYAPLVEVGSYVIVQDTLVGAIIGIKEFLDENDDFSVDRDRERLLISNNVYGFLKRVR